MLNKRNVITRHGATHHLSTQGVEAGGSQFFFLFIGTYNVWVISPPFLLPPPLTPLPSPPCYQAETILPLSLILLKREYKQ
jgi:hypothetical protein